MVLTLALAIVAVPLGAWRAQGHEYGWWSALVAFAVVWFGFTSALLATVLLHGTSLFIHAQLGTMVLRVGVPLGAGLVLQSQNGALAQAGVLNNLLLLYLVGLVVETLLVLPLARQGKQASAGQPTASSGLSRASETLEPAVKTVSTDEVNAAKEPVRHG